MDGKAHYVALNARDELANYPTGAVVEVRGSTEVRAADKNIAALASDGLYRTDHHLAIEQGRAKPGRDPQEVVAAHVRRLEACAGPASWSAWPTGYGRCRTTWPSAVASTTRSA